MPDRQSVKTQESENSHQKNLLQMFAWASLGMVLVSTFTFVLGTFPEFQKEEETGQPPPYPEAVIVMDFVGELHVQMNLAHHL